MNSALSSLPGRRWLIAASLALLIPCFWLPRIHAGDLSSHIYNAWLAGLVQQGGEPGLVVEWRWTNALFDRLLQLLLPWVGPDWTQRLCAALSVQVFFFGAFLWLRQVSRGIWCVGPLLVMLAYGRLFHLGFFNYYLSLGLAFWALCFFRMPGWRRCLSPLLFLLAAHASILGTVTVVVWDVTLFLLTRARPRRRLILTASLAGLILLGRSLLVLLVKPDTSIPPSDYLGAGHFVLYGSEFRLLAGATFSVLLLALVLRWERSSWRRVILDPWVHLLLLAGITCLVVPWGLWLPGYRNSLSLLDLRFSFFALLAILVLASRTQAPRLLLAASACLALAYFTALHLRLKEVDAIEVRVKTAVQQIPVGSRVVSSLRVRQPVDPVIHIIDRACIQRCFSYGNYEPASWAFMLSAVRPSRWAQFDPVKADAIGAGTYRIERYDLPLYLVYASDSSASRILVRPLSEGERMPIQLIR